VLIYSNERDGSGFNPLVPALLPIGRRTYFFSVRRLQLLATIFGALGLVGSAALPLFLYGGEYGLIGDLGGGWSDSELHKP
jgi:hypothetical protein